MRIVLWRAMGKKFLDTDELRTYLPTRGADWNWMAAAGVSLLLWGALMAFRDHDEKKEIRIELRTRVEGGAEEGGHAAGPSAAPIVRGAPEGPPRPLRERRRPSNVLN